MKKNESEKKMKKNLIKKIFFFNTCMENKIEIKMRITKLDSDEYSEIKELFPENLLISDFKKL